MQILSGVLLLLFLLPSAVSGAVTASPLIIDRTVDARDIFDERIVIVNSTDLPTRVFASVHEITLDEGGSIKTFVPASMSDRSQSVTSWLAIDRRRQELPPGASTSLALKVNINQDAVPGLYHAFIGFGSGSNRDQAEAAVLAGTAPGVIVRIEVRDSRVSALRLVRFVVDRLVFGASPAGITYSIENPGDTPLTPTGEVILYNSHGEEVGDISVDSVSRPIAPGETAEFTLPLPTEHLFGKYKAYLSLRYGADGRATVHDTAFFYAAPWMYLALLFAGLFIIVLLVVFWWRRALLLSDETPDETVTVYVRSGKSAPDQDHDLTLTKSTDT